ncbi:hypothetical protein IPG41_01495 [Candidatus Peregrinibacteria bacterium]|nr:MAG: hypothetical protein IPG41_01495 [Candidatus Peregrinibacteria bacterium]
METKTETTEYRQPIETAGSYTLDLAEVEEWIRQKRSFKVTLHFHYKHGGWSAMKQDYVWLAGILQEPVFSTVAGPNDHCSTATCTQEGIVKAELKEDVKLSIKWRFLTKKETAGETLLAITDKVLSSIFKLMNWKPTDRKP